MGRAAAGFQICRPAREVVCGALPTQELTGAGVTWPCELRFHGESDGWEAEIFRAGELFTARGAFSLKGNALRWAERYRKSIEGGCSTTTSDRPRRKPSRIDQVTRSRPVHRR